MRDATGAFEKLKPILFDVHVTRVNGKTEIFRVLELSYHEQERIKLGVPLPDVNDYKTAVVDGKIQPNPRDPDYLRAVYDAVEEREMRLLTAGMVAGGEFPELAHLSLSEQTRILREQLPYHLVAGIRKALRQAHQEGEARVERRAASFQPISDEDVADLPEDGLAPAAVVGVARG